MERTKSEGTYRSRGPLADSQDSEAMETVVVRRGETSSAGFNLDGRSPAPKAPGRSAPPPKNHKPLLIFLALLVPLIMFKLVLSNGGSLAEADVDTTLSQYKTYLKSRKRPTGLDAEAARVYLMSARELERSNRKAEAQQEWAALLVKTQNDRSNPLYQLALQRLNHED